MRKDQFPSRGSLNTCQSGNTSALIVPANAIAHLDELEVDTTAISGNTSVVTVKVNDTYTPTGGAAVTKTRVQKSLKCGDVIHVEVKHQPLFSTIEINCNISGPVVGLGVSFE